jgi:hypothetical protein
MGTFAFTLYEVFGYLLPGSVTLFGLALLYWTLFVPKIPLDIVALQPGVGATTVIVVLAYVIGHAIQSVGNKIFPHVEANALAMPKIIAAMRDRARETAGALVGIAPEQMEPRWTYRILDEYAVQKGQPGDRDMFIYREGFYRGTSTALFFLSVMLLVRIASPETAIRFSKWTYAVSCWPLLLSSLIVAWLGWMLFQRYKRFADYRVTRAVLSALVIHQIAQTEKQTENTLPV